MMRRGAHLAKRPQSLPLFLLGSREGGVHGTDVKTVSSCGNCRKPVGMAPGCNLKEAVI